LIYSDAFKAAHSLRPAVQGNSRRKQVRLRSPDANDAKVEVAVLDKL
jgi:hypothetical protein